MPSDSVVVERLRKLADQGSEYARMPFPMITETHRRELIETIPMLKLTAAAVEAGLEWRAGGTNLRDKKKLLAALDAIAALDAAPRKAPPHAA